MVKIRASCGAGASLAHRVLGVRLAEAQRQAARKKAAEEERVRVAAENAEWKKEVIRIIKSDSPHDIIGVNQDATLEEINSKYNKTIWKLQPCRKESLEVTGGVSNNPECRKAFHKLREAYTKLSKNILPKARPRKSNQSSLKKEDEEWERKNPVNPVIEKEPKIVKGVRAVKALLGDHGRSDLGGYS